MATRMTLYRNAIDDSILSLSLSLSLYQSRDESFSSFAIYFRFLARGKLKCPVGANLLAVRQARISARLRIRFARS